MNVNNIDIQKYNWNVVVLDDVRKEDINTVIYYLKSIHCPDECITNAIGVLRHKDVNTGFTYSNAILRKSIVCISSISSTGELVHTTVHELYHLVRHISISNGFEDNEEQNAYLIGDIARVLFMSVLKLFN